MADDIVTRLRSVGECLSHHECFECGSGWGRSCECLCHQAIWHYAAAEIERLRAELLDWERTVRAHEAENDELHDDLTRLLREIGRLRAAGDALDEAMHEVSCSGSEEDITRLMDVHYAWQEARRG